MAAALTGASDSERVASALDATRVVVVVPQDAPAATAAAAAGLVSMASRVFGEVVLTGEGQLDSNPWGSDSVGDVLQLHRVAERSNGRVTREAVVSFGDSASQADWYVGGDDWTVVLSRHPAKIGECHLGGLGLHAAAALAFGEILKGVLQPLGMICFIVEQTLVWNLLDGRAAPAPSADLPPDLSAQHVAILGAGSLGSSAVGILSMTPASGTAYPVDPDKFDPVRNTYRYPAVPLGAVGFKATWAADTLQSAGWTARPHDGTVRDWVLSRTSAGFDGLALVSVDRVDGRLDAADLLARTTISAGVAGLALHAQRSSPADDFACSYCAYVDLAPPMTQVEVYARLTGLPTQRIAQLLDGDTLTRADLGLIASTDPRTDHAHVDLVGGRLEDLLNRRYAQARVVSSGGLIVDVSAPHVSWIGGVLLAAEVVKAAARLPPLDRRVELDLSGVPLGGWRRPRRDPSGRCTCTNPIRRKLAAKLYAA